MEVIEQIAISELVMPWPRNVKNSSGVWHVGKLPSARSGEDHMSDATVMLVRPCSTSRRCFSPARRFSSSATEIMG